MSEGVKIGQQGTDIGRISDYDLTLTSEKPLMEIAVDQDVNGYYDGINPIKIPHKLGYFPAFDFEGDTSGSTSASGWYYPVYANESDVFVIKTDSTGTPIVGQITGHLTVYAVNMGQKYKDTGSPTFSQKQNQSSYGLETVKEGYAIDSGQPDDDRFSINTKYKSMIVHMIDSAIASTDVIQFSFTHGLGYVPTYYLFKFVTNGVFLGDVFNNRRGIQLIPTPLRSFADTQTISFTGVQSLVAGDYGILILKDPLLVLP